MNLFTSFTTRIREVFRRMVPYKSIEQAEKVETPISTEMTNELDTYYKMYTDKAEWLSDDHVHSLNLASQISAEFARQMLIEMKWSITGKSENDDNEKPTNPRSEYLTEEFEKLIRVLPQKLEQGCAAGGMLIKPYVNQENEHIYFDATMDWSIYPIAFDDDGNLSDVIIPDILMEGKTIYTRLERHQIQKDGVHITQRAFKSTDRNTIGSEINLKDVDRWSSLKPELTVAHTEGNLFGWFKVATANNVDPDCPLGASVFSKAIKTIEQCDKQYSRLLWEYEGSELAIDVDPTALRPNARNGNMELPKLNERLFRAIDIDKGDRDLYEVYAPNIRDANLIGGLNQLLMRVEDQCGISRGTFSDANVESRTATELRIVRQRTYSSISRNQEALEQCLRDVVRVMDKYASIYNLAPEGEIEISFEWDDSILTDANEELQKRMTLLSAGIYSKVEMREWYFGETHAQAEAAIQAIKEENQPDADELLPQLKDAFSSNPKKGMGDAEKGGDEGQREQPGAKGKDDEEEEENVN